jgi:hypothetical protein
VTHRRVSASLSSAIGEREYADLQHPRLPVFVQQQAGHEYASTLAIYTSVCSDYKTRTLRAALDGAIEAATLRKRAQ